MWHYTYYPKVEERREGFRALTSVFPETKVLAFTPSQAGRHFQVNAPRREFLICANLFSAVSWNMVILCKHEAKANEC